MFAKQQDLSNRHHRHSLQRKHTLTSSPKSNYLETTLLTCGEGQPLLCGCSSQCLASHTTIVKLGLAPLDLQLIAPSGFSSPVSVHLTLALSNSNVFIELYCTCIIMHNVMAGSAIYTYKYGLHIHEPERHRQPLGQVAISARWL